MKKLKYIKTYCYFVMTQIIPFKLEEKIKLYSEILNLKQNVRDRIFQLYLEAKKRLAVAGFSFDEIVSGLIFVAGILENEPIPIYKISKVTGVKPKIIWSVSTSIYKSGITNKLIRIPDIISIFREKLYNKLSENEREIVQKTVYEHLDEIKRNAGNASSRAIIGAILWLLGKKKKVIRKYTQKELANMLETNEVSIRIAAKRIRNIII